VYQGSDLVNQIPSEDLCFFENALYSHVNVVA
jgi:hypothetical protein